MTKYYVYSHINPLNNHPFYIGKGTGDRSFSKRGRSSEWKAYVNQLEKVGLTYSINIIKVLDTETEAFNYERVVIQKTLSQGFVLFNQQTGKSTNEEKMLLTDEEYVPNEDNVNGALATFVRTFRKKAKLTQKELANRSGVELSFIKDMEDGKPTLRLDVVNQVLRMFGHELSPVHSLRE